MGPGLALGGWALWISLHPQLGGRGALLGDTWKLLSTFWHVLLSGSSPRSCRAQKLCSLAESHGHHMARANAPLTVGRSSSFPWQGLGLSQGLAGPSCAGRWDMGADLGSSCPCAQGVPLRDSLGILASCAHSQTLRDALCSCARLVAGMQSREQGRGLQSSLCWAGWAEGRWEQESPNGRGSLGQRGDTCRPEGERNTRTHRSRCSQMWFQTGWSQSEKRLLEMQLQARDAGEATVITLSTRGPESLLLNSYTITMPGHTLFFFCQVD